jgi:O-antigen biosynthesis protein
MTQLNPNASESAMPQPACSVAICTRHRTDQLRRALASMARQSIAPLEVLVVDNAPDGEDTRQLVAREFPATRYVCERRQGLDFARNRALAEARGGIVAFLDDDAVAHPDWMKVMGQAFADHPALGLCTGRVEALELSAPGQRLFEANGGFSRGMNRIRLPADATRPLHGRKAPLIAWAISIGSGNNYAVRREAAMKLGGFDEALDLGEVLPGGGDHDLLWRMLQAGFEVHYEPAALAWHEHRKGKDDALRQIAGHQRALVAMLAKSVLRARGRVRWSVLGFLLWRLLKPGARVVRSALGRDPLPASFLLGMWWQCILGLTAYSAAQKMARHRAAHAR